MNTAELVGYLASLLVFTTFSMKTMIPLRVVAIISNITFIVYALLGNLYPILILHATMLPLNIYRLLEIRQMIKKVREAMTHDMDFSVLLPHMSRKLWREGDVVFNKGARPDGLYYIASGEIFLKELDVTLGKGSIMGEVSIFAPEQARMATAECKTDCELYSLNINKIQELYFQNPVFGFSLLRLITGRLLENLQRQAEPSPVHQSPGQ